MTALAFGRRVKILIYSPDTIETDAYEFNSDIAGGERGYKIDGTVKKYFAVQPPEAEVDIWNLSPADTANLLALRYKKTDSGYVERQLRMKIWAGYHNGLFGLIFDGQILKPNMTRPDPNNTMLKLVAIDSSNFYAATSSALTSTFNDGVNYYDIAKYVAQHSGTDLNIVISDTLKNYKVDGEFVTKNTLNETIKSIADDTGTIYTINNGTIYLNSVSDLKTYFNQQQYAILLNSDTGLIGIPTLNNDGISVQSILNPTLDVLNLIQLNNSEVSINQPDYLANKEIGAYLSADGLYRIVELTHQFDTYTGAFTTNMKCYARDYYDIYS